MPLKSKFFSQPAPDPRLENCLINDLAHIVRGAKGEHVKKIQTALNLLSKGPGRENFKLVIDGSYGQATADAVVIYKNIRRILQPTQKSADDIVGKRTMERLDDEMAIFEEESPSTSSLVCSDFIGAPHDHNKCPSPKTDGEIEEAPDKTMSHFGTPMNPLGFGRKINIGGKKETLYLGFSDFVPDPKLDPDMPPSFVNGRPFTSSIVSHTVSDVCFRSTPLDDFMKKEILRLCILGSRLTFVGNPNTVLGLTPYFNSIGGIVASGNLIEKPKQKIEADRLFVIVNLTKII